MIRETRDWGTTICSDPSNRDFRIMMPTSLSSYNKDLSADSKSFLQTGSTACSFRSSSVETVGTTTSAPVGIRSSEFGSSIGIGAVLKQEGGHGSHPVAFASRKLSSAKTTYPVHEREFLAIVYALKEWRPYLHGSRFGN
jgi:RNase H-like domain found in reverse transcriptase